MIFGSSDRRTSCSPSCESDRGWAITCPGIHSSERPKGIKPRVCSKATSVRALTRGLRRRSLLAAIWWMVESCGYSTKPVSRSALRQSPISLDRSKHRSSVNDRRRINHRVTEDHRESRQCKSRCQFFLSSSVSPWLVLVQHVQSPWLGGATAAPGEVTHRLCPVMWPVRTGLPPALSLICNERVSCPPAENLSEDSTGYLSDHYDTW